MRIAAFVNNSIHCSLLILCGIFSYSAEFSNKDIVQDLNRILKMSTSGNTGTLRMFTADTLACDYDNTLGVAMTISIAHQLQSVFINVTLFSKEIRLLMQL